MIFKYEGISFSVISGKSVFGRGNNKCIGFLMGMILICLRNSKEVNVVGVSGRVGGWCESRLEGESRVRW